MKVLFAQVLKNYVNIKDVKGAKKFCRGWGVRGEREKDFMQQVEMSLSGQEPSFRGLLHDTLQKRFKTRDQCLDFIDHTRYGGFL